jgi:hypothetical protein
VLERRPDVPCTVRLDLDRRHPDDDGRVGRERPIERADRGAPRVDIEIDDGREVQIDPGVGERRGDRPRPGPGRGGRAPTDLRLGGDRREALWPARAG